MKKELIIALPFFQLEKLSVSLFFTKSYLAAGYCKATNAPSTSVEITPLSKFLGTFAREPLQSYESYSHRHIFPGYGRANRILFYKGRNTSFNKRSQINVEISPIIAILFSSFPCLIQTYLTLNTASITIQFASKTLPRCSFAIKFPWLHWTRHSTAIYL